MPTSLFCLRISCVLQESKGLRFIYNTTLQCRFSYRSNDVYTDILKLPIPVVARPKARVCGHLLAGITGSNPAGA